MRRFECKLLNFDDTIYLIPNINSQVISVHRSRLNGISEATLREEMYTWHITS